MNDVAHWNQVYTSRSPKEVGWYKSHLDTTIAWVNTLDLDPSGAIIDVGGGASTLVDDLVVKGYQNLSVLDLSKVAIQLTQDRLGDAAHEITWLQEDITEAKLPAQHYCLWHDRAAFHFLIEQKSQQHYKKTLLQALKIGGYFLIGTFTPDAPPSCSGLPVQRYNLEQLTELFANEFKLMRHQNEVHITPHGTKQPYVYCLFQRAV